MAATVTLSTTTLAAAVTVTDGQVKVVSTAGIVPGLRLYIDQELLTVVSLGIGTAVTVRRGVDGTATTAHASTATVRIRSGCRPTRCWSRRGSTS
jgi:hypothetical protein